jgi:hypothetical protein
VRIPFTVVILALCGLGASCSGAGTAARDSRQQEAVVADSAALALVEEYLSRDASGELARDNEWLDKFARHAFYGSDFMSIISGYKIAAAETRGDTTFVTVHYDVIGGVSVPGPTLEPRWTLTDSVQLQELVVVRTEEGVGLVGYLPATHMSGRAVLERNPADEEYRRALDEAIRRKGGASVLDSIEKSAPAKSDALRLVEEYLRRDARGEFRHPSEWLSEVTNFETLGYDAITVISSHEILAEEARGDTTRITVQYHVRSGIQSGPDGPIWTLTDSMELQTFVVVRTDEGIRLAGPPLNPHMSTNAVLEDILVDEQQRRALEEAIRREGG